MEQNEKVIERPIFIDEQEINKMIYIMYNSDLPELKSKIEEVLTKIDEVIKLAKDGTI